MTLRAQLSKRLVAAIAMATAASLALAPRSSGSTDNPDQVLEWNQIFIDTLIATNTANSSSQRLGAIVHTAIFDAYNGIERRYTPIFVDATAPRRASPRAAVIAAAHEALVKLFPSRKDALDASYDASIASLSDAGEPEGWLQQGVSWGEEVAAAVVAWRAMDGFNVTYPPFVGGTVIGQWRPIPPATAMTAQSLAFTSTFVLASNTQFQPPAPRALGSDTYTDDFNAVKTLGQKDPLSSRTPDQTFLASFWEGNASVHWNQAANQIARANGLSMSQSSRLLEELNLAMADTAFTIWSAKRYFGSNETEVTWRPTTAIQLAHFDGNPHTMADMSWQPSVTTPSHPEYPAGHPAQNGAAATVLLRHFADAQTFTLTTGAPPTQTTRTKVG